MKAYQPDYGLAVVYGTKDRVRFREFLLKKLDTYSERVDLMLKGVLEDKQEEVLLLKCTRRESEQHNNPIEPEGGSGFGWTADYFDEIMGEEFKQFPLDVIQVFQHWVDKHPRRWNLELIFSQSATAMRGETSLRVVHRH